MTHDDLCSYYIFRMDVRLLLFWLEAFLSVWLSQAAPENFVVSVSSNVTTYTKHTAILPCWLSPQQSAEDMEVNWFHRDQFDAPVMLYKDKTINSGSQPAAYSGRVSFDQKDASSGGLKEGDVTLKLVNVTLADAGEYTCYVSSDKHHDRASISVFVRQTGVPPLLTAVVKENNKVNVSCESEGWYPEPQLQWSDGSRTLPPKALVHKKASSGLLSVNSWVIIASSSALSCLVGLPGEEAIEGRIRVETPKSETQEGSGSSVVGWVLFAIAAVAFLAILGLYLKKYRGKENTPQKYSSAEDPEELKKLLPEDLLAVDTAKTFYVNIGLEQSGNEYVKMKDNILRDAGTDVIFPDRDRVTCITAVRGTPGFTSGKHYWEVSLVINGNADLPPKKSWWIGVTSLSEIPKDCDLSPTFDKGFWFLSSSHDHEQVLQYNTNSDIYLGVSVKPRIIGVFLDYDVGTVTFFNVESKSVIGCIHTKFSDKIFPLFNPGKGDTAPMKIIHYKLDDTNNATAHCETETG